MNSRAHAALPLIALAIVALGATGVFAQGRELELTVKAGDTLIGLSERLLAKPAEWPKLQNLNKVADPRRLVPGSTLRIPVELLREESLQAEVMSVAGTASKGDGARLAPGEKLPAGSVIRTGQDGFVTLRAPDGALIALQPGSEARLTGIGRYVNTDIFSTVVRMISGRVEAAVDKLRGPSRFEVQTDLAVAGVRGTRFRVSATGGAKPRAQSEVLEGAVEFAGQAPGTAVALAAGFGSVTDETGRPRAPAPLLPAPALAATDALQERLVTRFRFAGIAGADNYRAQVARDRDFRTGIAEGVFKSAEIKFGDLPDGEYFWRVRSIKGTGTAADAGPWGDIRKFTLRPPPKTPEPPEESASGLTFSWAAEPGQTFLFQVARDTQFTRMVIERNLSEPRITVPAPDQGTYFLRVRAVDADGFIGPFTAPQRFSVINRVRDSGGTVLVTGDGQPVQLQ